MSDPRKRVVAGERLRLRADTFNQIVEAVDFIRAAQASGSGSGTDGLSTLRPGQVLIRNDSNADRDQFDVLFLGDVLIQPADNLQEWQERFAFSASGTSSGRWCVLAEPIADGKIGRAWITGAIPCRITGEGEWAAENGILAFSAGDTGDARVLWAETVETPETAHYAVILRAPQVMARLACVTEDWTANNPVTVRMQNGNPDEVEALAPNTSGTDTAGLHVLLIPLDPIDAAAHVCEWAIVPRECEPSGCEVS